MLYMYCSVVHRSDSKIGVSVEETVPISGLHGRSTSGELGLFESRRRHWSLYCMMARKADFVFPHHKV